MKRILFTIICIALAVFPSWAQVDTTSDRTDSLEATVFVSRQAGNYISKGKTIKTEVISSAGLRKLACCNLAESFENSASVTVGYSDAVTGARQIRLLGLSGVYMQMLDESRPAMRGVSAPFGLSYVPGQWLESIQIAKGASSVISGSEAMTGQINLEYRKPTDEKPLFVNLVTMNDTKTDFNIVSSLQMGEHWSTAILGHVSGNFKTSDHNHDGFVDEPKMMQYNLANRWLYYAGSGTQVRFGFRAMQDTRKGGNEDYDYRTYDIKDSSSPWGSDILNRSVNGYLKVGVPLSADNAQNIAFVADYTYNDMDSWFGKTKYDVAQHAGYANLLYSNVFNDAHSLTAGLGGFYDGYTEDFARELREDYPSVTFEGVKTDLFQGGAFAEYTFHASDKFTAIAGARADWYKGEGVKFVPRVNFKYSPVGQLVIRANAGRGLRYSSPFVDNIGVLSTSKRFISGYMSHTLEDAWTFGGNATWYLPFGASDQTYVSVDYFHTEFKQQMVVDYEQADNEIWFYNLDGNRSYSNNYQIDFNVEPVRRLTVTATFRYTDARIEPSRQPLIEKPMTSRYKGVLSMQYATNLNKWIFDLTASVNGPSRVYSFMEELKDDDGELLYPDGKTPVYPLLYFQITRRFKGLDVYVGGENLTNYKQHKVLVGETMSMGHGSMTDAGSDTFDASAVWGPIMGYKIYAGLRFTLWKHSK